MGVFGLLNAVMQCQVWALTQPSLGAKHKYLFVSEVGQAADSVIWDMRSGGA